MRKKDTIINKQALKKSQGQCRICGEKDYATLDVHRIKEGASGGKYTKFNTVVLCANCHRKVHDQQLKLLGYFLSSSGKYLLMIEQDQQQKFI
jgi:5-methylcytosine-specific restriction endonuclease McrA